MRVRDARRRQNGPTLSAAVTNGKSPSNVSNVEPTATVASVDQPVAPPSSVDSLAAATEALAIAGDVVATAVDSAPGGASANTAEESVTAAPDTAINTTA